MTRKLIRKSWFISIRGTSDIKIGSKDLQDQNQFAFNNLTPKTLINTDRKIMCQIKLSSFKKSNFLNALRFCHFNKGNALLFPEADILDMFESGNASKKYILQSSYFIHFKSIWRLVWKLFIFCTKCRR